MANRLTFKKQEKITGLASIATPYPDTDIKKDGKVCGSLSAPSRFGHENWKIRLIVKSDDPHVGWKWITLKSDFKEEKDARAAVIANWDKITEKFELVCLDD